MCGIITATFDIGVLGTIVRLRQTQSTVSISQLLILFAFAFVTYKAILEEKMVVLAALLTHPMVRGTYGLPQSAKFHILAPVLVNDMHCASPGESNPSILDRRHYL